MAFKLFVREDIVEGLDETYQFEAWADGTSSQHYYDVHCSVIEERETSVPTLRRVLQGPRRRILESGCGTGRWMAYFERLGHSTVGIDDSPGPLRAAASRGARLRFVRADALCSPFPDGSFDVVFSSYVAEHFEDGPQPLLREIRRVLKPNGILLIVVPYNNLFRRCVTNRMLDAFYLLSRWRGRGVAFTEMHYSRQEMHAFLRDTGFVVDHVEPDDFRFPWAKGLSLDLGRFVRPANADQGTWELNRFGRMLARSLLAISPWLCAAGVLYVARVVPSGGPPSNSAPLTQGTEPCAARTGAGNCGHA